MPEEVLDTLDPSKTFHGDEVAIDRLMALSGPKPKFQKSASDLGIGAQSSANPGQLTREQLRGMSYSEINKARKDGRHDALMKGEI